MFLFAQQASIVIKNRYKLIQAKHIIIIKNNFKLIHLTLVFAYSIKLII